MDLPVPSPFSTTARPVALDVPTNPTEPPLPPGMPGHADFALVIDRALADCRRRRTRLAVLLVTVLEVIPGDAGGDGADPGWPRLEQAVLEKLAQRMQRLVRATDQVVALDSRHIGVVLANSAAAAACIVDDRAQRVLSGAYSVADRALAVRLGVGRATFPDSGITGRELVRAVHRVGLSLA